MDGGASGFLSNHGGNSSDNAFWSALESLLDRKLINVAKKDDLAGMHTKIIGLQNENKQLRSELSQMQNKFEMLDRASKRGNVSVRGLKSRNVSEALRDFGALCAKLTTSPVEVRDVTYIKKPNVFIFELCDRKLVDVLLKQRKKLKGSNVFIQRDYTACERARRYKLRQLGKELSRDAENAKVRMGEFSVFVNDRPFQLSDGNIVARCQSDAEMLTAVLEKCKDKYSVVVAANIGNESTEGTLYETSDAAPVG